MAQGKGREGPGRGSRAVLECRERHSRALCYIAFIAGEFKFSFSPARSVSLTFDRVYCSDAGVNFLRERRLYGTNGFPDFMFSDPFRAKITKCTH